MATHALITRVFKYATIYRNRADYLAKTGLHAPPFDWSRPPKPWGDNRKFDDPDEEIKYTGMRLDSNGKPVHDPATRVVELRAFSLFPEVANTVNLPPEPFPADAELTPSQRAMAKREIPYPLELGPGERVVLGRGISSAVEVDDGKPEASDTAAGGFTQFDRNLLVQIAAKLGVS